MPTTSELLWRRTGRLRDLDLTALGAHTDHAAGALGDLARQQVRLTEEVGHERRAWTLVDLRGWAHLLDDAVVHDRDGVGHRHGLLLVMGDVHERDADLCLDPLELDLHLSAELEVQGPERLVEEEHVGLVDERARNRDALLLAARELSRLAPRHGAELHELEHVLDVLLDILDAATAQAERDVLEDVEVREQGVRLEDGVDRPLVRTLGGDVHGRRRARAPRSGPPAPRPCAVWWSCRTPTGPAARRRNRPGW